MTYIYLAVAFASTCVSLATAVYGVFIKDPATRGGTRPDVVQIGRATESSKDGASGARKKLSGVIARG